MICGNPDMINDTVSLLEKSGLERNRRSKHSTSMYFSSVFHCRGFFIAYTRKTQTKNTMKHVVVSVKEVLSLSMSERGIEGDMF